MNNLLASSFEQSSEMLFVETSFMNFNVIDIQSGHMNPFLSPILSGHMNTISSRSISMINNVEEDTLDLGTDFSLSFSTPRIASNSDSFFSPSSSPSVSLNNTVRVYDSDDFAYFADNSVNFSTDEIVVHYFQYDSKAYDGDVSSDSSQSINCPDKSVDWPDYSQNESKAYDGDVSSDSAQSFNCQDKSVDWSENWHVQGIPRGHLGRRFEFDNACHVYASAELKQQTNTSAFYQHAKECFNEFFSHLNDKSYFPYEMPGLPSAYNLETIVKYSFVSEFKSEYFANKLHFKSEAFSESSSAYANATRKEGPTGI